MEVPARALLHLETKCLQELLQGDSFTVPCEYKRRLVLVNVAKEGPMTEGIEDVADVTASGMLQVCIG